MLYIISIMSDYCTYYVTCMYIYGSKSFIQLSHTSQKSLDDACVDTVWHCCLKCHQKTDSTLWSALILQGYSYTLQEEDQFLCNISPRLIVPCFSMVIDCKKCLNYTSLFCPGGRYAIFTQVHCSHYFTRLWAAI